MRRLFLALPLLITAPAALAAQTDATATVATSTAPNFHAGQWAAQFAISGGFYGFGAMRFSSPSAAWTLTASGRADHRSDDPGAFTSTSAFAGVAVGRRWYRPGSGRIRPFSELGIGANYGWGKQAGGGSERTYNIVGGSFNGQLGATIFFAPELSLGASWNASLSVNQQHTYQDGTLYDKQSGITLQGGAVSLSGAFYF